MRQADAVLVVLALVVTAATATAVVGSDAWTTEKRYSFSVQQQALPPQGPSPAGAAPARFTWVVPDNATAVALNLTIAFAGQALQGGEATIRIQGKAPDGSNLPTLTTSLAIPQGATASAVQVPYAAAWLDIPDSVQDTQRPPARAWIDPLVVTVTVDAPNDAPLAAYAFTAQAAGAVAMYRAS